MTGWSYTIDKYNESVFCKLVIWEDKVFLHDNLDNKNYRGYTIKPTTVTNIQKMD
jgi:hypothetical protein